MTHPIRPHPAPAGPEGLKGLLSVLRQRHITLQLTDDEQLSYQAPAGALTPALKQQLAAHKAALVAYLKQAESGSGSSGVERASSAQKAMDPTGAPNPALWPPHAPAGAPEAIRLAVVAARDWEDLEPILDAVQAACEAGGLDRAQAENLARLAARVSRAIPARVDGIKAEELLPPQASQEETDG